jgi:hypothetical protein
VLRAMLPGMRASHVPRLGVFATGGSSRAGVARVRTSVFVVHLGADVKTVIAARAETPMGGRFSSRLLEARSAEACENFAALIAGGPAFPRQVRIVDHLSRYGNCCETLDRTSHQESAMSQSSEYRRAQDPVRTTARGA